MPTRSATTPRAITTRRIFHIDGRPISWVYFWREVWRPALELAHLDYRAPYNLRHTFAYWSLKAGVPIATVAKEMGADAATLRETWATSDQAVTATPPTEPT